jgi:hypothetical protein
MVEQLLTPRAPQGRIALRDRAPARPLLQEAMEEGVLPAKLGPQRPGRVAQLHPTASRASKSQKLRNRHKNPEF